MSGKQSGHTPQPAIKHLHHVVLWSAKERNTEKKDTDRKGEGCLQKKQRQTWKNTRRQRKKKTDSEEVRQRKKQTKRMKLRKDTHIDRQRECETQRQAEERDGARAEQLKQKSHCLSATRSRVHQPLVHRMAE